jgi:hypothetical protein
VHWRAIEKAPEISAWLAEQVERVGERERVNQDQRALAEIVQQQGGQHIPQPGEADRAGAKMAHVGIQRLRSGDGEHDRAEGDEGEQLVLHQHHNGVARR